MFKGPLLNQIFPNWNSVIDLRDAVKKSIEHDISMNWKVGPFLEPPFENFVGSPMGAFAKSSKTCVTHDLSWPPERSINCFIPSELCSVKYISVEDAVSLVKERGPGCLMSKVDLSNAYKQVGVRPKDWPLLGTTWLNDEGSTEYYYDTVLPFGCRSSAVQFDKMAQGLEYMMKLDGATNCIHYLDDTFTCGAAGTDECLSNLETILATCAEAGVALGLAGFNPANFSGNSFRAGAATTAGDLGFEDYELKMLGRWSSSAYTVYLRNPKIVSTFAKRLVPT